MRAQPWHSVPIVGARSEAQLRENLGALDVELTSEHVDRLSGASELRLGFPRDFLESEHVRGLIFGDTFELIDDPRSPATRERVPCLEPLQGALEHRVAGRRSTART